jgi:hypothetical protein
MLNELSNTVVFERPREEAFVRKWQLACEGDIAHVVVMPNIDIDKLEEFVQVGAAGETGGQAWGCMGARRAERLRPWQRKSALRPAALLAALGPLGALSSLGTGHRTDTAPRHCWLGSVRRVLRLASMGWQRPLRHGRPGPPCCRLPLS